MCLDVSECQVNGHISDLLSDVWRQQKPTFIKSRDINEPYNVKVLMATLIYQQQTHKLHACAL